MVLRRACVLVRSLVLLSVTFFSITARAQTCDCVVDVGNQNRKVWGSWALECNNHGGHGDCPTTNIDTAHSPGASAMTGDLYVYARQNGVAKASWKRSLPDDHVTAFKGPVYKDGWEWTNTCSCDAYRGNSCGGKPSSHNSDYNAPMYAGPQEDRPYVFQGRTSTLRFPAECGNPLQQVTVHESIRENDPFSADDHMGVLEMAVPANEGTFDFVQWVEHFEPAFLPTGQRTHAGYAGGSFGAEIVLKVRCNNVAQSNDARAPEVQISSHTDWQTVESNSIQLMGTATDYRFGGNGISSVTINGVRAANDAVSLSGKSNWSRTLTLNEGLNTITLQARDNSSKKNLASRTLNLYYFAQATRGPAGLPTPVPTVSNDRLNPGQALRANESITSQNGQYVLVYQGDGNLVVYHSGQALWASNTFGIPGQAVVQNDGNFVIYDASGTPLFHTGTWGYSAVSLVMQNDGNAILVTSAGQSLWSWITGNLIGR